MEKENTVKYQTVTVTVPNGTTTAQSIVTSITLDNAYAKADGIVVYNLDPTNPLTLRMGLQNDAGTIIQNLTFIDDFLGDVAVAADLRYKQLDQTAKNRVLTITTQPTVNITTDLVFDVIFRLKK